MLFPQDKAVVALDRAPQLRPAASAFWNRKRNRRGNSASDDLPTPVLLLLALVAASFILFVSVVYLSCAALVALGMWLEGLVAPRKKT